jgi:hypothetical protein
VRVLYISLEIILPHPPSLFLKLLYANEYTDFSRRCNYVSFNEIFLAGYFNVKALNIFKGRTGSKILLGIWLLRPRIPITFFGKYRQIMIYILDFDRSLSVSINIAMAKSRMAFILIPRGKELSLVYGVQVTFLLNTEFGIKYPYLSHNPFHGSYWKLCSAA